MVTLIDAGRNFLADAGTRKASQLAFHLILAAPAALVFAIWILSLLDHSGQVREAVVDGLVGALPLAKVTGERELASIFDSLSNGAGTVGLLSIPVLLYSTSSAIAALRFTVEVANGGVPESYHFLRMKGEELLVAAVGVPLLVLIALLAVSSTVGEEIGRAPLVGRFLYSSASSILLFLVGTGSLVALFRILDFERSSMRGAFQGALLAGLLSVLITEGLSLWFSVSGGGSLVYGILAAFMGLMVFAYLIANAIAYGAFVSAEITRKTTPA